LSITSAPARPSIFGGPLSTKPVRSEGFTYEWHIAVQQIIAEGQRAASWIEASRAHLVERY
jgi:hypothetical protein